MKLILLGLIGSLVMVAMLSSVAAQPEKTDGFVCPVFHSDSVGEHNPNAIPIGEGHYTIPGPDVSVPIHATNGDGAGTPPGPHSEPGDTDYTAVWAGN